MSSRPLWLAKSKPDLDQIWDQKISTPVWSLDPNQPGKNFYGALDAGKTNVVIYYLLLHHQGDRGTKTKCENYIFCLRGSKNIFHILGSEFGPPDDRSPPPASRQAKSGFGTRNFQDESQNESGLTSKLAPIDLLLSMRHLQTLYKHKMSWSHGQNGVNRIKFYVLSSKVKK